MRIEIVTHCLRYSRLLSYQLGSLTRYVPSDVEVVYTLFYSLEDTATCRVVALASAFALPALRWNWQALPVDRLNRRSIGRNLAALATKADWVWFADADYCFGVGCLSALASLAAASHDPLLFPRRVSATSHTKGDELVAAAHADLPELPCEAFVETQDFNRAIGGIQIVRGDVCRRQGYLRDHARWQRPMQVWRDFRDDVAFRRSLGTRGVGLQLPGVYRIRHTAKGVWNPGVEL